MMAPPADSSASVKHRARLPRLCAETIWRLAQAPASTPAEWLSASAATLTALLCGEPPVLPVVARIALLERSSAGAARIIALGTSDDRSARGRASPALHSAPGGDADELGAALILAARRDWPDWGQTRGGARRALIPDRAWAAHPLLGARSLLGFDEFAVFESPVPDARATLSLVLQVDRRAGRAWDETAWVGIGESAWPLAGPLFEARVWRLVARRSQLLSNVSQIQQQIVPLLVAGKTERAIAAFMRRSPHTVHDHVKLIYESLGVASRHELIDAWHGADTPPPYPSTAPSGPSRPPPAAAANGHSATYAHASPQAPRPAHGRRH